MHSHTKNLVAGLSRGEAGSKRHLQTSPRPRIHRGPDPNTAWESLLAPLTRICNKHESRQVHGETEREGFANKPFWLFWCALHSWRLLF